MEKKVLYENIVKFNFMSNIEPFAALDYSDDKNFGFYSLIPTCLDVLYTNKRINSISDF
jgi:hypothetical protein